MVVVNKSSWRPYWRISPPETLLLFSILIFKRAPVCMFRSSLHILTELHFWFACWHFVIKPAANFDFFPSSLLLTRLILTSRNSYCLVHHLGPITRPLIILIVRERVLAIIVSFVFFRFNRSSSTVTTCIPRWTTYQGRF